MIRIFFLEHSEYEILDNILKETGGLEVDLHFDTPEYEGLLGSEIINLYKKYKESNNIKRRHLSLSKRKKILLLKLF